MLLSNRTQLPIFLLASALLVGCGPSEPVATETPVEEAPARVESFTVDLSFPEEGADGAFTRHSIVDGPTAILGTLESHYSVLEEGKSSHAPHTHRAEEIIFPIHGDVEIYRGQWEDIEESRVRIGPGQFIFHASNHSHAMSALGPGPARYWVMQWEGGPTGAEDHILPPSTFDYRQVPDIDAASGVGSEVLVDSQTPNAGRYLGTSIAMASGATIQTAAKDSDTVLITLTSGIEINGEALAQHTVGYYPAGMEFGVENTGGDVGRYVAFEFSK
ncbi:MAG: cupin domain-containing protein [Acidobacteria bacterium]|nr:cupin domain-containing protein [Acidobacteriota bacterium]